MAGGRSEAPGRAAASASRQRWRAVRRYLNRQRHMLTLVASTLYPDAPRVEATPLLAMPGWLPAEPIALDGVELAWSQQAPSPGVDGTGPESSGVRPLRGPGEPYRCYAEAVAELDPPRLFENRRCYRLLSVRRPAAGRRRGSACRCARGSVTRATWPAAPCSPRSARSRCGGTARRAARGSCSTGGTPRRSPAGAACTRSCRSACSSPRRTPPGTRPTTSTSGAAWPASSARSSWAARSATAATRPRSGTTAGRSSGG